MTTLCVRTARLWRTPFAHFLCAALALTCFAAPTRAEEEPQAEWKGTIRGQVVDSKRGTPVGYATITLIWPAPADGSEAQREQAVADPNGGFEFESIPAGVYTLSFSKTGYQTSTLIDFTVTPDKLDRADFHLPPLPETPEGSAAQQPEQQLEEAPDVEEFVVLGARVEALEASRAESDELINTLSAEDFAKFDASDVADALKFVAGVNVVEGQFAIIRGLEDRYSSTLYNSAPIPSPDPDRQSVQLDLFPSDVVGDLVVAKTFGPDLPSNSSGGSINILTHAYPEDLEVRLKGGTGVNQNAVQRFIRFESGSPIGAEADAFDTIEGDAGASIGGRTEVAGRELRFKAVGDWDLDYVTRQGFQEAREPRRAQVRQFPRPPTTIASGDLSLGELNLTQGRFDMTESERAERTIGYGGLGFDLDESGYHKLDASVFYTRAHDESVQLEENGTLPRFDYARLAEKQVNGDEIDPNADFACCATLTSWIARTVRGSANDEPSRGPLWSAPFFESESIDRERDLLLTQINGDHRFELFEGLHVSWAANYARTTQDETALGARYFFEPDDTTQIPTVFPTAPEDFGSGQFAVNAGIYSSHNQIDESQRFGRLNFDYEANLAEMLTWTLASGGWYEDATRDVDSSFLESPSVEALSQFAILADTPQVLGRTIFAELDRDANGALSGLRDTSNAASREIAAWSLGNKLTLWERLDLLGGLRLEKLVIESRNQPFIGEDRFGAPDTFPTRYLFFDRLDNPARLEVGSPPPPGTTFNDQILGIDVPVDPVTGFVDLTDQAAIESLVNGEIDELLLLPAAGITYRPLDGLAVRAAYSQTVARPSFREMGFYVSVEPGSDDLVVGNPQLTISEVESWDGRIEYTWGELGDLAAISAFYKTIQNPIESIVVRNPLNAEAASSALFRTFFNNPNEATLWGVELEARKNAGFLGPEILEHLSIGGNFTYIDAEVDRTDIELARSAPFFGTAPGDEERFSRLAGSRRLFGQPEWIVNTDLTFDHPEWGTKATLAFFAISSILDAAGSAALNNNNDIISFTLDRYLDSFHQLDLIVSQTWHIDLLRGDLTLKATAKNLTDSTRRIVYDPDQTAGTIAERSWKAGRDFSVSLTYSVSF